MTQQPHLALVPLKREPAARGKRAPRVSSIVGWFSRLPWLGYDADSVAPPICHRARAAARALFVGTREDAQNDSRLATTRGGSEAVRPVGKSPRFDGPEQLLRDARSVEPVQ